LVRTVTAQPGDPSSGAESLFAERARFVAGSDIAWMTANGSNLEIGGTRGADPQEPQPVGSITKVFSSAVLAVLAARGTLALSTTLEEIFRGLPLSRETATITLLELATHTSGLPRLPGNLHGYDVQDPYADYPSEALFDALNAMENGAIIEGRGVVSYSNFGYAILGQCLSARTRTPFAALLSETLFDPLGMEQTTVTGPVGSGSAGRDADGNLVPPWHLGAFAPAGGARSTVTDLHTFATAFLTPEGSLGDALRRAIEPAVFPPHMPPLGLGWICMGTVRFHNGETGGHHAAVAFDTASGRSAAAIWNAACDLDDICLHLVDRSLPLNELPLEQVLTERHLARFVGSYRYRDEVVRVDTRAGRLRVHDFEGSSFVLYAAPDGTFFSKRHAELTFEFTPGAAENSDALVVRFLGSIVMQAHRTDPAE
jgi:D-alanyl-D-alanine-carboxypeptidase/D-alanyl-D-alanine-endopeptidase